MASILQSINDPSDLRRLDLAQLEQLAGEVRELIIRVVSHNRGHLASNLGVVELTLALHYCYDFLSDRLIWDCGHQAYAHKIVTGRRERFATLRQKDGVSGFADRKESPYDAFTFGHTATSISSALGLACADATSGKERRVVAVIGDGAMASGMAFEALNHAGALGRDLLVVLNDNKMSISNSVGAIARYLGRLRATKPYTDARHELHDLVARMPRLGGKVEGVLDKVAEGVTTALSPGGLFVELGFHYYGPVNGHDMRNLVDAFRHMKRIRGPLLLHVLTEKGHGFEPASKDPTKYHSSRRFDVSNGAVCGEEPSAGHSYSSVVGEALCQLAKDDARIVAITAAMPDGTGLTEFSKSYPGRFYDVGICEQHATGFASGLCAGGMRPVFAVYSTFLQRAFDQVHHDVALQEAPVVFCVDRAGLVGSDGPTHHGLYDITYCRAMPGMVVMAPKDAPELRRMLRMALAGDTPVLIRYPRENVPDGQAQAEAAEFKLGQAEVCRRGPDGAIIALGAMVSRALDAARMLKEGRGLDVTVVNARFARPLDAATIAQVVREHPAVLTAEDHSVAGGFGSAVLESLSAQGVGADHVRLAGVPLEFITHATREEQLQSLRLDAPGLAARLLALIEERRA
jgi:1-deoxy-D-xylulose-5-phosphate synthase